MVDKTDNNQKIQLLLLQESMWQIEDKIDRSLDEIAKHQAALLLIKSMTESIMHKLGLKPTKNKSRGVRR